MTRKEFAKTQFKKRMFFKTTFNNSEVYPLVGVDFQNYTLAADLYDGGEDESLDWFRCERCILCDKDGNAI